jgi:hypothetical protein
MQAMRVLSLGHCSSVFVVPLYREIGRRLPGIEFEVLGFVHMGENGRLGEQEVFRRFHQQVPARLNWPFISGLARACVQPPLWWRLWWRVVAGRGLNREMLREIASAARMANLKASEHYELYHFHFCTAECLRLMDAVPSTAKLICSFWGSDLLRTHGVYEYVNQSRALERADAITVQSLEMREIVLSKFGRHLLPKVHCVRFPLNGKFYELIDVMLNQPERVDAFRRELGVPEDRVLVTVGHNGNPANNQLPIIEALSRLSASEKAAAVWVFPMKYLNNESHIRAVEKAATAAGLEFRLMTHYLDWPELAAFRIATDVLIHLPISDALSGTVQEVIYAGNCVIAGAWLPYSPFRKVRLPLVTVEDFAEVPSCISQTLLRLGTLKREATEARQRIRDHFFAEAAVPPWVEIYRRLLGFSSV